MPFILLDDAREVGRAGEKVSGKTSAAADALLYERPSAIFAAYQARDVERVLKDAQAAQEVSGGQLAGYIAYEAGLSLEPKLAALADARTGAADGPRLERIRQRFTRSVA